jgi:hypothetical protein
MKRALIGIVLSLLAACGDGDLRLKPDAGLYGTCARADSSLDTDCGDGRGICVPTADGETCLPRCQQFPVSGDLWCPAGSMRHTDRGGCYCEP